MRFEVNPTRYLTPKIVSFDTEYSDLNLRKAKLLSVSIGVSPELTYIFDASYYEELDKVAKILDEADLLFTWNMVVDHFMLGKYGIGIDKDKIIDAMLLEHLIDENLDHGLGDYALRECNDNYKKEFWSQYKTYQEAPKEVAYEYEMRDGAYTFRAGARYLESLKGRMDLVRHVHRLQWALFDTEIEGIKVDVPLMEKTKSEMSAKIAEYLPKLRSEFNEHCQVWELKKWKEEIEKRSSDKGKAGVSKPSFSFSSDKQVSWLVYDALEIEAVDKTKKGNPSTSFESLNNLREHRPELGTLVDYKETKSVYSTFVEGMLDRVDEGRIYPRFNINGTTTGRISHSNPNMGNLPTEGVIRNFFLPDTGRVLYGADYSQLEVVVEANLTEDKSLLKIILEGVSKHDITAEGLGLPRNQAKTLNFALQYGAGVHKIAKMLGVPHSTAQDIYTRYWELYSGVRTLKEQTSKTLQETGQVTNIFGRTRHFPKPKDQFEGFKQERQAYNFLIQGVGADMTNMATYELADRLRARKLGRLWFSVHDEIVCETKENLQDQAIAAIVESLEVPNEYLKLKYKVQHKLYGPLKAWSKA